MEGNKGRDNVRKMKKEVDKAMILVPTGIIVVLAVIFFVQPEASGFVLEILRDIFVNKLGFFYILLGLFVFFTSIYLACSRFGTIRLGTGEKPRYSNFKWGAMIFTSTMAADILYWSMIEWAYYFDANPNGISAYSIVEQQQWSSSYPLFHWGPIPWSFYLLPAAAYAYRFFVKKKHKQSLSSACDSVLKNTNGILGKGIDVLAVVGLLAGTATTFSLATPLISKAIEEVFHIPGSKGLTILILAGIGICFSVAVLHGMKAISKLAVICVCVFFALLGMVFLFGPKRFIVESGISGIGNLIQNFLHMSTWTDPLRATGDGLTGFPQNWTIFYWAYWIAWFVATPFFIAKISEGRTIKQMIAGGYLSGIAGTFLSFIVFGNFGLYQQTAGKVDAAGLLAQGEPPALVIIELLKQLPFYEIILVLLIVAMVAFYASTFDALTMVVAGFSSRDLKPGKEPGKGLRVFWAIIFLIFPIVLIWSESTLVMLQTLSIIVAFPLGIIMVLIIAGFFIELRKSEASEKESED